MAELPDLGAQCSLSSCSQLDFLPFVCQWCGRVFCRFHFQPGSHNCQEFEKLNEGVGRAEKASIPWQTCPVASCRAKTVPSNNCQHCRVTFCLTHRFPDTHDCPDALDKANQPAAMDKTRALVDDYVLQQQQERKKKEVVEERKGLRGRRDPALAAKVALMKLKQSAKGQKDLPVEERVYLSVKLPPTTTTTPSPFPVFVSKHWSVGRAIDVISELAGVRNDNHRQNSDKLRLFTTIGPEDQQMLPVAAKWSDLVEGKTVFNGGDVEMRYVASDSV